MNPNIDESDDESMDKHVNLRSEKNILLEFFAKAAGDSQLPGKKELTLLLLTAAGMIRGTVDRKYADTFYNQIEKEAAKSNQLLSAEPTFIPLKQVTILPLNQPETPIELQKLMVFSDQVIAVTWGEK